MFFKIVILKNFANFTRKHQCWSLFLTQVFSYEFCKRFKNSFFTEHLQWLLLKIMNSSSCLRVLPIVATKQFHQFKYYGGTTLLAEGVTCIATVLETRTTYFKKEPHFLIDQPRTCRIFLLG